MEDWKTSLRVLLDEQKFDWGTGVIIVKNNDAFIEMDCADEELDHRFSRGFGDLWNIMEAIFSDARYIYVLQIYDGSPAIIRIPKDIKEFLSLNDEEKKDVRFFIGGGW